MQCPVDQTTLAMTERQGIEIDYCPTCRGIWLDRGELDKLIAGGTIGSSTTQPRDERHEPRREDEYSDDRSFKYGKKRKKESFLENLFDF